MVTTIGTTITSPRRKFLISQFISPPGSSGKRERYCLDADGDTIVRKSAHDDPSARQPEATSSSGSFTPMPDLAALYDRHAPLLYAAALRITGSPETAAEVLVEVF